MDGEAFSYDRLGNRLTATRAGASIGASGSTTNYYVYYPATQTGAVAGYPPVYSMHPGDLLQPYRMVAAATDSLYVGHAAAARGFK